jgi:AraC family transcriptional regulator of adaptative response/methylated-DNA-[protein]-cysteine methyltransferase
MLLARTGRGISMISFADDQAFLEAELKAEYPRAVIRRDDGAFAGQLDPILDLAAGGAPAVNLPLDVQATAFQAKVWARLKAIPAGETRTYGEIAAELGRPGAARAVGRACASNPVSLIVPCHRVVGGDGTMHGYRWGAVRKQELLARERKRS